MQITPGEAIYESVETSNLQSELIKKESVKIFAHQVFLQTKSTTCPFLLCNDLFAFQKCRECVRRKCFLGKTEDVPLEGKATVKVSRLLCPCLSCLTWPLTDSPAPKKYNIKQYGGVSSQTGTYLIRRPGKCELMTVNTYWPGPVLNVLLSPSHVIKVGTSIS